ncbi:MAG: heavy-metal-associated domain-containing protein [Spirochaetota bacterium]|nr:heavy-metal-associated domain-containing protein [Spirochaetota bacterium]
MDKEVLSIPNITCNHCVMTIKNELMEIDGVLKVDGNPDAKNISVEWEPPANLEKIKDMLKEINYPASG